MKFVPNKVSRKVAMTVLKSQKHSPAILFGVGVVGFVGTAVLTAKATLKIEDILDDTSAKLEKIRVAESFGGKYTEEDKTKDKALVYTQAAISLTKLYAPALCLGVVSVGALAGSHRILSKRNAALTAAYAGLDKALRDYRGRVAKEVGEEREQRIWMPTEEVEVTDDKGKKKKVERVTGEGGNQDYMACFDQTNVNWNREVEYNQYFLSSQLNWANERLRSKGFVFLNDVREALGFERTKAGQVAGWIYEGEGDGYISFGIFDGANEFMGEQFIKGEEPSVWLNFNVDGNILDKI